MDIDAFILHPQLEEMDDDEMEDTRLMAGTAMAVILLGAAEAHRLRTESVESQTDCTSLVLSCFQIPVGQQLGKSYTGVEATEHISRQWALTSRPSIRSLPLDLIWRGIEPPFLVMTRTVLERRVQVLDPLMQPVLLDYSFII